MQADWLLILCLTPQQKMSKKMQYINAWHARIQKKIPGGKVRRLLAFAGGGGAVTYIW